MGSFGKSLRILWFAASCLPFLVIQPVLAGTGSSTPAHADDDGNGSEDEDDQDSDACDEEGQSNGDTVSLADLDSDLSEWLTTGDFSIKNVDIAHIKTFLRTILSHYDKADSELKPKLKNAFISTMLQHNVTVNLFDIVDTLTDEGQIASFIRLLHSSKAESETNPLVASLWQQEKRFLFIKTNEKDAQIKRLILLYRHMDIIQLKQSLTNQDFWKVVEDVPEAAALGLGIHHYDFFVEQAKANIVRSVEYVRSIANKVVPRLDQENDPEHVYNVLNSLAVLIPYVPDLESAIQRKSAPLRSALNIKCGNEQAALMMKALKQVSSRK